MESANTTVTQESGIVTEEEILDEQGSTVKEEIVVLQSPAEYEPETNNNDCKFYKQSLAKQALAGVF